MGKGGTPGEFELLVLLTLAGLEAGSSGRRVYEALTASTGREASVAAVHITLSRVHEKGWVDCETVSPEPGEGGKPRRFFSLSGAGADLLREQRRQHDRLWEAAQEHPLLGER